MKTSFRTLFTVALEHGYYTGPCADLDFVVSRPTADTLRNGRSIARVVDGVLHVLTEFDESGVPTADYAGTKFTFGLRLVEPHFANVTAPVLDDPTLVPCYQNRAVATAFDPPEAVTVVAGLASYQPRTASRPLSVRLRDSSDRLLATCILAAGETACRFELGTLPAGRYALEEDDGGSVVTAGVYLDREFVTGGVWGIVAVTADAGFAAAPPAFTIALSARADILKFFVVAKNFTSAEFDQLQVTDAGFVEEARPEIAFEKVTADNFTDRDIAPELLERAGDRVVLFQSLLPVARRERGYRKLQLTRNGLVFSEHLPLPGADRADSSLIVQLIKP